MRELCGAALVVFVVLSASSPFAQSQARQTSTTPQADAMGGEELYRRACAACHASDGRGEPRTTVGFETPLPDFTDCAFASPEASADWIAIVHQGGRVRAFDQLMPAFGALLSNRAIERVVDYVRGFCPSPAWPRGELNLPRPLVTEKAFPENEVVISVGVSHGDNPRAASELLYEQRLGSRSQFEISVPIELRPNDAGWHRGLGDLAVAFKHTFFHSLRRGTIASAAAEVVLPTGKESDGLGSGTTVFEPFLAIGQILPDDWFVHIQGGIELPANSTRADREAFWRTAVGKTFVEDRFGRSWSPMIELLGARDLAARESANWDLVPQLQFSLSKRQHILVSAGVRVPMTERRGRSPEVLMYALWDWFDGGLFDGWR
jgi:mono/diheme cytochrome c family protein